MSAPTTTGHPGLTLIHRAIVIILPVLLLVQATIAGQYLFEGMDIAIHGILGNIIFALAVVAVVLTVLVRRSDGVAFAVAVAVAALSFAQIGLGYVGRETSLAAAWHIPVGVTIFGLVTFQLALVNGRGTASRDETLRGAPRGR